MITPELHHTPMGVRVHCVGDVCMVIMFSGVCLDSVSILHVVGCVNLHLGSR